MKMDVRHVLLLNCVDNDVDDVERARRDALAATIDPQSRTTRYSATRTEDDRCFAPWWSE